MKRIGALVTAWALLLSLDVVGGEMPLDPEKLAASVTIYRDAHGVPHIDGSTDASVIFAMAYVQAEDFFWQVEDSYIMALGRYAEVHGPGELQRDIRNRLFRIASQSRADQESLPAAGIELAAAFAAGLNFYLARNPDVKPRLIRKFEPWHVLAYARGLTLELCFGSAHVPRSTLGSEGKIWARRGSNAWAIAPSRTRFGHAMLLINPHQPWYGFGQFYEAHLRSGEGWNFTGATFPGSPIPSLGHNEHAGWSFTVNEPDVADVWRETFDNPDRPLDYRYGDGYRTAVEWTDTIRVKTALKVESREYTFRRTHRGPVVARESETIFYAVQIAPLRDCFSVEQALALLRVRNLREFKRAMGLLTFPIFNAVYADRHGDIYYLYNGVVPRRQADLDWRKPVDGSDPDTEWRGLHPLGDLPQLENPDVGYLQSCNSSPFTTVLGKQALRPRDYPRYMLEDARVDKRRSKLSRMLLGKLDGLTFQGLQKLAFDTTLYWPLTELQALQGELRELARTDAALVEKVKPYFDHLRDWDCRVEPDSTAATLCVAWYHELFGRGYPGETLKKEFRGRPARKFEALVQVAKRLEFFYSSWKVPYGDINRLQRHANVANFFKIPFEDKLPSLPCVGAPGPLGVVFTVYFTPPVMIPFVKTLKKHYAIVGSSYMAVVEFGDRIRGVSLLQHGQSGDPDSPHFFDQARLMSERRMKPQYFYWDDVRAHAVRVYHPGEE